jgi:hypothetical protein
MFYLALRRLLQRDTRPAPRRRRSARPVLGSRFRPRLEVLEDRTLPAVITWNSPLSGDWAVAGNWDLNRLPTVLDDVVIGAGVTVTYSTGTDQVHSLTSSSAFVVSGGTLTLASASALTGTLDVTGGRLDGPGSLTVSALLTWTGGTLGGTGTTTANGGLAIDGSATKTLDGRTLANAGAATWAGSGDLSLTNGAVFSNLAGATFDVRNDQTVNFAGGVAARFDNAGTLTKSAGSGTSTLSGFRFSNSGAVQVQAGTLSLNLRDISTGSFTVEEGATLAFSGNSHTLSATSSVTGAGTVDFRGGTVDEAGTYDLTGTTTVRDCPI